ncbi:hypothetical protein BW686_03250 [Pseudomonas syringae]|uniref:DUF1534 domain-containing protein n=1 Tax=Pseudomonas syringae TaxID=317 RepID=A0A244EWS4_PSESX|nr:hypothetical protein BW686_03250 [Pseudomonas syringae]
MRSGGTRGVFPGHRSFLTLQRGNALRDAPRHRSAPRPSGMPMRSGGTRGVFPGHRSFLTLQRGNALRDAPRHRSLPCQSLTGRRAIRVCAGSCRRFRK